jgi:phosphatidylglycerophosphatase A
MPKELLIIRNHIKILCGNDDIVAEYFEKWIGQMILYPSTKTICPTLISEEGAGKGTLLQLLSKMFGKDKYFETTDPASYVWGKFNAVMADCFLVCLDELSKKDCMEAEGKIKGLITNSALTINEKNTKAFNITSIHRFISTTNKEEPQNTHKGDRRNLILKASDELVGNEKYFTDFYEMMEDVNVVKTAFEYFKSLDGLDKFRKIPLPYSEYQEELKTLSKSFIEMWVENLPNIEVGDNEGMIKLDGLECLVRFKHFCETNGLKYEVNTLQLMVRIGRLKSKWIEKKNLKTHNVTVFNLNGIRSDW